MKSYFVIAVCLVLMLGAASHAEDTTAFASPKTISAPFVYASMLVLSSRDGVAAVKSTKIIDKGVIYRFRFRPKGSESEQTGENKVLEKYERVSAPGEFGPNNWVSEDRGSRLFIEAGPIRLKWSYASEIMGHVYYRPETLRVQIADGEDFDDIDLTRFSW